MIALFLGGSAYLFVYPPEDDVPADAQAIVVLSGGQHRLNDGLRLWRAGVARTLVISDGLCFRPKPYSTRGEARWTGARGWRSVVVVTSTYHVRRTRELFERCVRGRVAVVAAEPPLTNFLVGIAWEWPKSPK